MTETNFTVEWLSERYRFDAAARNKEVEQSCIKHFQNYKQIKIVDIGAGHGSNFFYLFPKFPQHQEWVFVELNASLLETAFLRLAHFAKAHNYPFKRTTKTFTFNANGKEISIYSLHASFLDLGQSLALETVNLLTAGAVFDLLSVELFEQFATQLIPFQIPLLSTINYAGMRFWPQQKEDTQFLQLYEAHMLRMQNFGQSMGADCMRHMLAFFEKKQITCHVGDSNWAVAAGDTKMQGFLLQYLENAILEMPINKGENLAFKQWLSEKRQMVAAHQLKTTVLHQDLFAHS